MRCSDLLQCLLLVRQQQPRTHQVAQLLVVGARLRSGGGGGQGGGEAAVRALGVGGGGEGTVVRAAAVAAVEAAAGRACLYNRACEHSPRRSTSLRASRSAVVGWWNHAAA